MTQAELSHFRRRLLAMQKRLVGTLADLEDEGLRPVGGEASGGLSNVPVHPADLGTDNSEEEFALELVENEHKLLLEVEAALERIEQGTYGQCVNCGRTISMERLKALPYARYCYCCAQKLEAQSNSRPTGAETARTP